MLHSALSPACWTTFCLGMLALTATGCGKPDVELGTVTGVVTMEGEPLPDAIVRFLPTAEGRTSQGTTDSAGRYKLEYSPRASGARVGPATVMIMTGDPGDASFRDETVAFEFNHESTLTVDVQPGKNVFDFDVKRREIPAQRPR